MIDQNAIPAIFYTACYQIVADGFGVRYKNYFIGYDLVTLGICDVRPRKT